MKHALRLTVCGLTFLCACSSSSSPTTSQPGPDAAAPTDDAAATDSSKHALVAHVALNVVNGGVSLFTQNGSTVTVPLTDLSGKMVCWLTTKGGESIANGKTIDLGMLPLGADGKLSLTTPAHYPDGPWELGMYISVTGADPAKGPQPGDVACFSIAAPPPGDPPITGNSVRMDVKGADAVVTLDNSNFIRF